jgi:hypothetical protein
VDKIGGSTTEYPISGTEKWWTRSAVPHYRSRFSVIHDGWFGVEECLISRGVEGVVFS